MEMVTVFKRSIIVICIFLLALASVNALTEIEKKRLSLTIDRTEESEDIEELVGHINEANLSLEEQAPEVMEDLKEKGDELGVDVEKLFNDRKLSQTSRRTTQRSVQSKEDKKVDYIFLTTFLLVFLSIVVVIFYRKEEQVKKEKLMTDRLKSYINTGAKKGYSSFQIKRELINKGWKERDIDRAYEKILSEKK
jgi:predicted PurR-regulated permease PerM